MNVGKQGMDHAGMVERVVGLCFAVVCGGQGT